MKAEIDGHAHPAGQAVHVSDWPVAKVPRWHTTGAPAGVGHMKPAGHGVQKPSPSSEYQPSAHGCVCVLLGQAMPDGHRVQLIEPLLL